MRLKEPKRTNEKVCFFRQGPQGGGGRHYFAEHQRGPHGGAGTD